MYPVKEQKRKYAWVFWALDSQHDYLSHFSVMSALILFLLTYIKYMYLNIDIRLTIITNLKWVLLRYLNSPIKEKIEWIANYVNWKHGREYSLTLNLISKSM